MKLLYEWWLQIWPNLAASGITFTSGLVWARRKFLAEMERREVSHLKRHGEIKGELRAMAGHLRIDAKAKIREDETGDDLRP